MSVDGRVPLTWVSTGPASEHEVPGHPERPDRVSAILGHLASDPALAALPRLEIADVEESTLHLAHTAEHVASLRALGQRGGGWVDPDTYCGRFSYAAALRSVGAALAAADAVIAGRAIHAFSLSRPPGHHATTRAAMGFCLLNNVAIAARWARRRGVSKLAIVDIDVHHGNGTEEIFWEDPSVLYTSLHQWPLYPGTGAASDRGGVTAPGLTVNVPVPPGTTGEQWLEKFDAMVLPAISSFAPELLLVSAGFDGHAADPLASLLLTEPTYAAVAGRLDAVCVERGIGAVWLLEGGYDLRALAESVGATLHALVGRYPSGGGVV
ncbi:MAG TPA: histone deacetylase [Candidatus Binatia bacterium]|nr:histone deacetylase [Candidatus Binatia bacterium]